MLRSSVSQREKEKAERATLVVQERLVKAKARAPSALGFVLQHQGPGAMLVVQTVTLRPRHGIDLVTFLTIFKKDQNVKEPYMLVSASPLSPNKHC